ncbi:protein kinase domain-containing protein [Streptomyces pseudovenezuelae]|uniref:Outer membrane protein assembly factor BamB n=1 Tax=Streptomyces pseudovenezuelae TaxID=67350 RepID=A0ABT6L9M3_9ACTN|nr:PQQ-binding-like beta-propeller repeat protein [Streptomyces pseudovenezuelae]MDH6213020.1 outer membrane protein assembly factor BamB [Streptomyces pseudovenezuelae]
MGSIGGYALIDRLGSGGMGVVYLGLSASGRQAAVKVVHAQYALDEEFRARFRQEIAAARRVSGAFTAPVVDADPEAEMPWMATLYVPGRTLAEAVEKEGPLGGRALRMLALGLVEALRDIHQAGVVHRDLKPSNVLMAEDGPRVIDFGISRAADNQALTVTGRLIGTPPFMSPEQFSSPKDVTAASDVFSLGSLLVYAATGNRPFDGASPYLTGYQVMYEQPRLDGVAEPLRSIAARCLDKNAAERPQLAELHRLLLDLPDMTDPPTVTGHRRAPRRPGGTTVVPAAGGAGAGVRGRRVRRLVVLGAALAGTVVCASTAYYLTPASTSPADPAAPASEAGGSASRAAALPAGWQPWRTSLVRAVKDKSLSVNVDSVQAGCASAGSSVYCSGTGFTVGRLDAATGRVKWRFGSSPQSAERPLGVRDGIVYGYDRPDETEVNSAQRVFALDVESGDPVWTRTVDAGSPAALFDGGALAMTEGGKEFVALDARTGKDLWRSPVKSSAGTNCAPLVLGDAPYGVCVDANDPTQGQAALLHLDPADGTVHELHTLPLSATPLGDVGGQPLFLVPQQAEWESNDGRDEAYKSLLQVDPSSGRAVRLPLAGTPRGTATLVDGTVYFVRPDGTVTANRASDGARLWQQGTQIENLSAPVLSSTYDDLYFANRYGRLLALDRKTGAEAWTTDKVDDLGTSAEDRIPSLVLVKDAIVAVAGDKAFSVSSDRLSGSPTPSAVN